MSLNYPFQTGNIDSDTQLTKRDVDTFFKRSLKKNTEKLDYFKILLNTF